MQQAAHGLAQGSLLRPLGQNGNTRGVQEIGPCVVARIDVRQFQPGFLEECRKGGSLRDCCGEPAQFTGTRSGGPWQAFPQIAQNLGGCHGIQLHVASRGKEWKTLLHLLFSLGSRAAQQCTQAPTEAKLLAMATHEIEHRAYGLVRKASQAASQLLQEKCGAVGGSQKQQGVHTGNVHPFIEQVHGKYNLQLPRFQITQRCFSIEHGRLAGQRQRGYTGCFELRCHELRMRDRYAKTQRTHTCHVADVASRLLDDQPRHNAITSDQVGELLNVVSAAPTPTDAGEIGPVADAVVGKRAEPVLIDGVPKPEFRRNAFVKPVQDGFAVTAFGRCRKPQHFPGFEMVDECFVRIRSGVVEFIDDQHIEPIGIQMLEVGNGEALDGGEHVLERIRLLSINPELAKCRVAQRVAESEKTLVQDFLAVGDKQQSRPRQASAQSLIVECRHHRLAGASRRNQQVAMPSALPRQLDQFQQSHLEGLGPDLHRTGHQVQPGAFLPLRHLAKLVDVEGAKIFVVPVAFKHRTELVDHIGIACAGHTHVPFKPGHLGRMREVG